MVGAVAGRAVAVAPAVVARQEPVERVEEVGVGAGPDLDDDEAGRGVRDEDGQQPVAAVGGLGDEARRPAVRSARPRDGPGPDGQLARVHGVVTVRGRGDSRRAYGKMLRRAARKRAMTPPPGAES